MIASQRPSPGSGSMKPLTFYRSWLFVPYAFAALVYVSRPVLPKDLPDPWLTILLYAVLAVAIGAIPYGVIAFLMWLWLPGKSPKVVRLAFLAAPPLLLAIVLAISSLRFMWRDALLVSYAYVFLFLLTEQIARRTGLLGERKPPTLKPCVDSVTST